MLWASKQVFTKTDVCTCYFTTDPDDGPSVHDDTCARRHDDTCRMAYRPDITPPRSLPFGWGKHLGGCCCVRGGIDHACDCRCQAARP